MRTRWVGGGWGGGAEVDAGWEGLDRGVGRGEVSVGLRGDVGVGVLGLWLGLGLGLDGGGNGFVDGVGAGNGGVVDGAGGRVGLALIGDDAAAGAGARTLGFAGFVLLSGAGLVGMFRCYGWRSEVAVSFFFTHNL